MSNYGETDRTCIPTIFDAIGIPQPTMVNGIAQRPWNGVSMVYTWDKASRDWRWCDESEIVGFMSVEFPDSKVLPTPTSPFSGFIEPNLVDSMPGWPPTIMPPEGAPNVLLVLIDDAGFGSNSAFDGVVPTPTVDKLAQRGLRYTQMHNTALCSPTRAALLTGRNHHAVGFGMVTEGSTGYPGYDSITGPETAHGAAALKENGYSTAWFGKNHNVPVWEASPQGPFTGWPIGQGYDYFYGFVGGDTSQWEPGCLFRNTTAIHPYNERGPLANHAAASNRLPRRLVDG